MKRNETILKKKYKCIIEILKKEDHLHYIYHFLAFLLFTVYNIGVEIYKNITLVKCIAFC